MIQVSQLRVDYDQVCAVQSLDLEIQAGEIFGLIGPNGAGKTSTLRAVMGLIEPTSGEIRLDGLDLHEQREAALQRLGFMPDFSPLYEDLTVWEFLDLWAHSYEVPAPDRERLITEKLEVVDLTEKRDAFTAGLSRGMKQRLMLAKTLIPDPPIVLLDEPASGMDPHSRLLLRNIVIELGRCGRAVVLSSHILAELSEMCTSIGIMERGRMVVSGRVEEIRQQVMGHSELVIQVLGDSEALLELLRRDTAVGPVQAAADAYRFPFAGDDEAAADLLARLVGQGIRVASYHRHTAGLDELFMRVGAREVA
ncbi:MAG: ABC transporter ATP-binding protein [Armatimonadetes bacterium]|nr:ABC transporter ATP-binding protein [Armatimonadota bacterium]